MKLLIIFIIANFINVVIQTIKSIATIKCNKYIASLVNAIAYGFYTYIVILMVADLPTIWKCLIVGLANLVGVFLVKLGEEKSRKDKLWLVKMTVPNEAVLWVATALEDYNISNSQIEITGGDYVCFDCYCRTQEESKQVIEVANLFGGKTFATESKIN